MPDLPASSTETVVGDSELIHRWLENQQKELQLKIEQNALSVKELDHNRALSEKAIDAQLKDRSENRICSQAIIKQGFVFVGVITFMLLVFGAYVINSGKEAFLSEVISLFIELGKVLIGAVTGFFIAKSKYDKVVEPVNPDDG